MTTPNAIPLAGLDALLGLEYLEASGDRVVIRWTITPDQHQPFGIVHGGVYCAVIESAASLAGYLWAGGGDSQVVGVANHTNFLRGASDGVMTATATPIHRGRTNQLWQVEVRDELDRLIARGEVRLHNLSGPSPSAPAPGTAQ
jgi:uncharacterized protein (TIGR00369 family)